LKNPEVNCDSLVEYFLCSEVYTHTTITKQLHKKFQKWNLS